MHTCRFGISLAAIALVAACSSAPPRGIAPDVVPMLAEKPTSGAAEREVRYYTDSQGMLWDDRGRNLGPRPIPAAPVSP